MSGNVSGPAPSETDVFTVLRAVLSRVLPPGLEMVRGQENRVPEPRPGDFIVFWPLSSAALSTPVQEYDDTVPHGGPTSTTSLRQGADTMVQMDVHGPNSAANAKTLQILSRSAVLADFMAIVTQDIAVLYADDPHQTPFENAESQWERRWVVTWHLQVNSTIRLAQQFADVLRANVINVAATYPP